MRFFTLVHHCRLAGLSLPLLAAVPALTVPPAPLPYYSEPAIAPDRQELAFVSGGDIWTVPVAGGEARLLVAHPATESRPLYAPDGKSLAFTSTRSGNGDIYLLNFASGELKRLALGGGVGHQQPGLAAGHRHRPNITARHEGQLLAVGRYGGL
jgi:dipeptidyl aminopeptidase/acylaminoacyl peptidase